MNRNRASERLKLLYEMTSDAIWDWDLTTDALWWSYGIESQFGYSSKSIPSTGNAWIEQVHPDDRDRISASIHAAIDHGQTGWSDEYRYLKGDGTYAYVSDRGKVVRDEAGKAIRMIGSMVNVSDRRHLLDALKDSKERLDLALDSSGVGTWTWDVLSGVVDWDLTLYRIFGHEPDSLSITYDHFVSCLHPDDRERVKKEVEAAVGLRAEYDTEYRVVWPDGNVRYLASRGKVYLGGNGAAKSMTGVCWDITQQKLADLTLKGLNKTLEDRVAERTRELRFVNVQLRDSEEQFRSTFEQAAVGVFHVLPYKFQIMRANRKFCDMLGYTPDEIQGLTIVDITDPRDIDLSVQSANRMSAGEMMTYALEKRYLRKDGTLIWVQLNSQRVNFPDGTPKYFVSVVQDISLRREMEEELKQSLARFQLLSDSIPQQLWTAGPDGGLDHFNSQTLAYFGRTYDEMSVQGWQAVIHPDDLPRCIEKWTHSLKTGDPYEIEFRLLRSDRIYRWHLGRALSLRGKDGAIVKWFGSNTDIDDQKKAERLIARQRASLANTSKMSSLGEMAGSIAHEINNPLAIIHGRARILREMAETDQIDRKLVAGAAEKLESTALRISKIVKSLRSFARDGSSDHCVPASIRQIVDETVELCQERFRNHGITLQVIESTPGLSLECRSVEISQVLLNLLNNAHDAVEERDQKWVKIDIAGKDGWVCVQITDSGPGIPAAQSERIMEPFFTTKAPGRGTGLGLSVSKGIVESHGGALRLDRDHPNTCFVVELPKGAGHL